MSNYLIFPMVISIILLTTIGQLLLKKGANFSGTNRWLPNFLMAYINRYTIPGYIILLIVAVLSIYILEYIPLKFFFPLFISGNLIAITILSIIYLHEAITIHKFFGMCVIIFGIVIFSV